MHVASSENCKELYELSGWYDCSHVWKDGIPQRMYEMTFGDDCEPAYDLGYLLRKLPHDRMSDIAMWRDAQMKWGISIGYIEITADTPEDAACLLAIELFKQGILSHD